MKIKTKELRKSEKIERLKQWNKIFKIWPVKINGYWCFLEFVMRKGKYITGSMLSPAPPFDPYWAWEYKSINEEP
jgi:hypothetical protein